MSPQMQIAENVLEVAITRALQMYRGGARQEDVYWMLLHAGLTAEVVLG